MDGINEHNDSGIDSIGNSKSKEETTEIKDGLGFYKPENVDEIQAPKKDVPNFVKDIKVNEEGFSSPSQEVEIHDAGANAETIMSKINKFSQLTTPSALGKLKPEERQNIIDQFKDIKKDVEDTSKEVNYNDLNTRIDNLIDKVSNPPEEPIKTQEVNNRDIPIKVEHQPAREVPVDLNSEPVDEESDEDFDQRIKDYNDRLEEKFQADLDELKKGKERSLAQVEELRRMDAQIQSIKSKMNRICKELGIEK